MSKVCQLFSSSKGNCILISHKDSHFLVDIGVSAKRCEQSLKARGIDPADITAVFVTHEHRDHAAGIRVFASRHKTPVFATEKCIEALYKERMIDDKVNISPIDYHLELDGVEVLCFRQSHDSVDCVGYRFNLPDGRSVCVCTDTGYITEQARQITLGTDLIFIESNHEISMLMMGNYPYSLKKRILGERGHLSNLACSEYIKELAQSGTTRFVLSHLSEENNAPELARQTAVSALNELGLTENRDFRLFVSPIENFEGEISL